jgi:hypothetical protein
MAEKPEEPPHQEAAAKNGSPLERPQDVRLRTVVVMSFWALILFVGVPMWWQTTSIHRAQLPLPEMLRWADGQVNAPLVSSAQLLIFLSRTANLFFPSRSGSRLPICHAQKLESSSRTRSILLTI